MSDEPERNGAGASERFIRWGFRLGLGMAGIFVVVGFVAAIAGYAPPRHGTERLADLGNWGSYLQGTTASLWSLAALLIIFVAFLAQKQQLLLQQRQFERQSFESSFFQLLSLHSENVR